MDKEMSLLFCFVWNPPLDFHITPQERQEEEERERDPSHSEDTHIYEFSCVSLQSITDSSLHSEVALYSVHIDCTQELFE